MNELITDIDIISQGNDNQTDKIESVDNKPHRKLFIESYGCQMNFSDSEIVTSIMQKEGFQTTKTPQEADVIFINTCSIRDKAEQTVRRRLTQFNSLKSSRPDITIGVLGCMAERLKTKLLEEEKIVDLVAGPDAYRDLPNLIHEVEGGQKSCQYLSLQRRNLCRYKPGAPEL